MSKHQVPEVAGIDLDFTPASYFTERDPHLTLPSDILGKARRDMARQLLAKGEDPPPELLVGALTDDDRAAAGRIHPMFMGGEYLPPVKKGEVEIARISLQSVSADQISVRARRSGRRISYSIVDEYGNYYMNFDLRPRTSSTPLSMRQLAAMLDGACEGGGAVISHTVALINIGESRDELCCFVSVESNCYPDLGRYYEARFDEYFASLPYEDEKEESDE